MLRAGFQEARRHGSHRFLVHQDGRRMLFAVHETERVGPKRLATILKDAHITPEQLRRLI
ncbi:MAG: type II toxin-antitoxin system HicA family toxin [Deltaproteobacteria bacterium]|nr:type II toxin-antitoxin system HicA family toxin [Deltaproteobacteria bacterium]